MCSVHPCHDLPGVNRENTPATFVSLTQAADLTALSTKTLRRRISEGTLPASRAGRLIRIKRDDLELLFRPIPNAGDR